MRNFIFYYTPLCHAVQTEAKIQGLSLTVYFTFSRSPPTSVKSLEVGIKSWKHLHAPHMNKDIIAAMYKANYRSLLNYTVPVWTSFLSDTQWWTLQTTQYKALCIANDCFMMTNVYHLHEETRMLPVR